MYVLDTDHMSLLEWGGEGSARLRERLADLENDQVATTIISYEEQIRGWAAFIARAKSPLQEVTAYQRLRQQLANYCQIPLLDFDERAAHLLEQLRSSKIRVGTMDLKIAAIVIVNNATLLTRNTVDFGKVPGLTFNDWAN